MSSPIQNDFRVSSFVAARRKTRPGVSVQYFLLRHIPMVKWNSIESFVF